MNKSLFQLLAPVTLPSLLFVNTAFAQAPNNQQNNQQNSGQGSAMASQGPDESSLTGTVVSSSRNTMVIRLEDGSFRLFTFDENSVHPARVSNGARVRVGSTYGDDPGYRLATNVTVEQDAPAPAAGGAANARTAQTNREVIPPTIRSLERDIERNVRRYRVGVRAGVGMDPEVILIGVQAQVGPIFTPNLTFRPSVDFGWGELTSLFSINPDFIYRLPVSARNGRWSAYAGVGPGFTFLHQNLNTTSGGKRIDFGEFHSSTGLNILGGLQYRGGMFAELRTSVYAEPAPTLRLIFGYNF
jgi:hypothetical protein